MIFSRCAARCLIFFLLGSFTTMLACETTEKKSSDFFGPVKTDEYVLYIRPSLWREKRGSGIPVDLLLRFNTSAERTSGEAHYSVALSPEEAVRVGPLRKVALVTLNSSGSPPPLFSISISPLGRSHEKWRYSLTFDGASFLSFFEQSRGRFLLLLAGKKGPVLELSPSKFFLKRMENLLSHL